MGAGSAPRPSRRSRAAIAAAGVVATALIVPALSTRAGQAGDPSVEARQAMVAEHIEGEGVTDARVLEAMRTVPRHLFVSPDLRRFAYLDQALDIGFRQTISPPFIVASMTELLDPQPTDRVLEIGTGSGYQAAVLSGLVKDVYTIEIVEPLGRRSAELLKSLHYDNVHCRIGDGADGWPEHAPFDKIIVTCSPESVPPALVDQLKDGGRIIIPLGERYQQVFHLLQKHDGRLHETQLMPALFVPMTGAMEELRRVQPDPAHPRLVNGDFELDANHDGQADGWHYQRRTRLVRGSAPSGEVAICFENDEPGRSSHMLQGLALDGSRVPELEVTWSFTTDGIKPGADPREVAFIALHFFDAQRAPCGRAILGPLVDDEPEWKQRSERVVVPDACREAIVQAGLNGATGRLCLDGLTISPLRPQPRNPER
jgi:protein-L-isoaspartate(D-aspartate) O-methyltransferase